MASRQSDIKDVILAKATGFFARFGYAGTDVERIAKAARVTKPTVYYHFGSKAGLFKAVMDQVHEEFRVMVRMAAEHPGTCYDKLSYLMHAIFRFAHARPDLVDLGLSELGSHEELPPELDFNKPKRQDLAVLAGILEEGQQRGEIAPGDAASYALAFHGLVFINVLRTHIERDSPPLDDALAAQIVDLFFNGVRLKPRSKAVHAAD